jgi:hypothetical protein
MQPAYNLLVLMQDTAAVDQTQKSPLDLLVVAELEEIKCAESELARAVSTLTAGNPDEVSELWITSMMARVRERLQRLDRMLDAMACA